MKAGDILNEAARIVEGSRQKTHGDKERSFATIASFWTVYVRSVTGCDELTLDSEDVALMMVLMKLSRAVEGQPHPDHYVDMSGYAGLAGEMVTGPTRADTLDEQTARSSAARCVAE